jgi:hypothetical protein
MQFNATKILSTIKTMTKQTKLSVPEIVYMSASASPVAGKNATFNLTTLGTSNALQSSVLPLYKDASMKNYVGDCLETSTVYFVNLTTLKKYSSMVTRAFKLPKGDIGVSHTPFLQKMGNYFDIANNTIEIAPIVYGTGAYLNARGFVAIAAGGSTMKMILIFLTV